MIAKTTWTIEQAKQLQKRLNVWPSGNLEHETWAAIKKELGITDLTPSPTPTPAPNPPVGKNPFYVLNHWLYEYTSKVNIQLTPNLSAGVIQPELIVIHYTGDNSLQGALSWLTRSDSQVSCHLVIAKTGVVWQLAPFNRRAWHAGSSEWDGRSDCNSWSIGIENVGLGDEWPDAQVEANQQVVEALTKAYGITEVVGHDDVAPGRKVDPGPRFPWDKVWPLA